MNFGVKNSWAGLLAVSILFAPFVARSIVLELRVYEATEERMPELHQQFGDHTLRLLTKHGVEPLGCWTPVGRTNQLVVLLRQQTLEAAGASWGWLNEDPEWKKLQAEANATGRLLTGKPTRLFLRETEGSPRFLIGSKSPTALFELQRRGVGHELSLPAGGRLVGRWRSEVGGMSRTPHRRTKDHVIFLLIVLHIPPILRLGRPDFDQTIRIKNKSADKHCQQNNNTQPKHSFTHRHSPIFSNPQREKKTPGASTGYTGMAVSPIKYPMPLGQYIIA